MAGRPAPSRALLARLLLGEALGTHVMVLLGVGSVAAHVLAGWPATLPGVAACWVLAVLAGIAAGRSVGSAELNPAVSLALSLVRPARHPWTRLPALWAAQLAGALLAGHVRLACIGGPTPAREAGASLPEAGGLEAVRILASRFPPPGSPAGTQVGVLAASLHEAAGTALVVLAVLLLSAPGLRRSPRVVAVGASLAVGSAILVVGPVTQAALNPARDLGPRAVALACGWGRAAWPCGTAWAYLLAPLAAAALVGLAWRRLARRLEVA
ncbi:MAG: aquaporin [Planctomycetia bacterium]